MSFFETHLRPIVAEMFTALARRRAAVLDGIDASPLVVIAPHQDDETVGCAGLIALKRRLGAQVTVVYLTDGSASLPGHPVLKPAELARLRRDEALAALAILGVEAEQVHFLDGPDGGMSQLPTTTRDGFVARLRAVLAASEAASICVPFRWDLMEDHEAVYRITLDAVAGLPRRPAIWEYPVWVLWFLRRGHLKMPEFAAMQKLDIAPVLQLKHRALRCFKTQIEPTPPWTHRRHLLSAGFLRRFRTRWELFAITPGDL